MKRILLLALSALLFATTTAMVLFLLRHRGSQPEDVNPTEDAIQFVNLTDVVPDAILEIRYFGTYNFVGERIDGYLEPTALLTREAADSLKAVSNDVKAQGYAILDDLLVLMDELRESCDKAETMTAKEDWPFPTYGDLLFGV